MPAKGAKRKTESSNASGGKTEGKKVKMDAVGSERFAELLTDVGWKEHLSSEFSQDYFKSIENQYNDDVKAGHQVFPPKELIFNSLNRTPLNKVKVVLLGQDPYHDDGQATGLSFSVPKGLKVPPSLNNMYKELATDIPGYQIPSHGCLDNWADQGVLLLNATLTVIAHKPNSHSKIGWQKFTDKVIQTVSNECSGVVFLLWGNFAHKKEKLINDSKHVILKDAHPSPLSFGKFKGCKCFSRANAALKEKGKSPINW